MIFTDFDSFVTALHTGRFNRLTLTGIAKDITLQS